MYWGGRIRTCACRNQNPVSYRLTTPQWRVVIPIDLRVYRDHRRMVEVDGIEPTTFCVQGRHSPN